MRFYRCYDGLTQEENKRLADLIIQRTEMQGEIHISKGYHPKVSIYVGTALAVFSGEAYTCFSRERIAHPFDYQITGT